MQKLQLTFQFPVDQESNPRMISKVQCQLKIQLFIEWVLLVHDEFSLLVCSNTGKSGMKRQLLWSPDQWSSTQDAGIKNNLLYKIATAKMNMVDDDSKSQCGVVNKALTWSKGAHLLPQSSPVNVSTKLFQVFFFVLRLAYTAWLDTLGVSIGYANVFWLTHSIEKGVALIQNNQNRGIEQNMKVLTAMPPLQISAHAQSFLVTMMLNLWCQTCWILTPAPISSTGSAQTLKMKLSY
jgi:hypothetical protein